MVAIDEFQQLLGNATKGTLVALRQLIWGLRTRELPLGLLLTMDPDTERTLADRAGDILHRIKDDGLGGVMIPAMWMNQEPYHHTKYDPVWRLCEELQLPVSTHSGPAGIVISR